MTGGSKQLLAEAARCLAAVGVPSPQVDALLLLEHVTGRRRHELRLGVPVTAEQRAQFTELVDLRRDRTPVQHLTGWAPFRYLQLSVGPGVFVPRPETELLVDVVLGHVRRTWQSTTGQPRRPATGAPAPSRQLVVDLCTGSAALALAVATELPGTQVVAVELSEPALAWAGRNVAAHRDPVRRVGSEVQLVAGDATRAAEPAGVLAHLCGQVDIVVSNPPYIPDLAVPRDPEVRDHDPPMALFGGPDGLAVVRQLLGQAALLLRPGGLLVVEHADHQGEAAGARGLPAILRQQQDRPGQRAWEQVADHLDLADRPRCTSGVRIGATTGSETGG